MHAPLNVRLVKASGNEVVIEWEYSNKNISGFLIEWCRDGKQFRPMDEIQLKDHRKLSFRHIDKLPVSGRSFYRVIAYRNDDDRLERSKPSEQLCVKIVGPGKGDV